MQLTYEVNLEINGKYFSSRLQLLESEKNVNKCMLIRDGQILTDDCKSAGFCMCKTRKAVDQICRKIIDQRENIGKPCQYGAVTNYNPVGKAGAVDVEMCRPETP